MFKFTGTFEMGSQVNPTLTYSQVDACPNSSILTCDYRTVLENRRQCRQMLGQVLSGAGKLNLPKYAGYANPVSFRHRLAADGFFKIVLNYILYLERAHIPRANSNIIMPASSFFLLLFFGLEGMLCVLHNQKDTPRRFVDLRMGLKWLISLSSLRSVHFADPQEAGAQFAVSARGG